MIITDFTAGELSPRMSGRFDLELYNKGASELENWLPFVQGGVTTRPGTQYLGTVKTNATGVRLIPFNVTDTISYILELGVVSGVGYLRFWKAGVLVESSPGNPLEFTSGDDPVLFPYVTTAQIAAIQIAQDGPDLYFAHRSFPPKLLSYTGTDTFTFGSITITGNSGRLPFQSSSNYPGCVAVWGGRLWFASSVNDPQRIWASEVWDETNKYTHWHYYDTVSYTVQEATDPATWADPNVPEYADVTQTKDVISDSNAIDITIGSDQLEKIQWLAPGTDLVVGTATSEFVIPKGVSALTTQCNLQSRYGSAAIQGFFLNSAIVFAQGGSKRLREYFYQDTTASYQSPDLTFHAEHIFNTGITSMDFAQNPQPMIYCVRSDGELAVLVYEKGYNVNAWCRYVIDGAFDSVAVAVESDGADSVYAVVTVNSVKQLVKFDDPLVPVYNLDSYVSTTKAATVSGLTRFNGKTVNIVHGTTVYSATVSAGAVTCPSAIADGQTIGIGLPYTCTGKTNKINQFTLKRIPNVNIMLLNSYSFDLVAGTNTEPLVFTAPFTGDIEVPYADDWNRSPYITFTQSDPLPATILAIAPEKL